MSYTHDSRTGVNSRALRIVMVFIPSRSGEVSTCFFTGAPTDLLVESAAPEATVTVKRRDWLGICHVVITRRVTPESLPMLSPSTHILDHIVHLTPPASWLIPRHRRTIPPTRF